MLSAQSVRHKNTYLHPMVFLCWALIESVASRRVASRCVVSICRKLRQRQLYGDPPAPSSLAFRQRSGIAVHIEAMGFGGTRADRYGGGSPLILEETLTTSPTNDLAVPPPAWSINRPNIEQRIKDRLRCSRLFKRIDGRHFRTCPRKGKRTIIAETQAKCTREQSGDAIGAIALRRLLRVDVIYLHEWTAMSAVTFMQRAAFANRNNMSNVILETVCHKIFPH